MVLFCLNVTMQLLLAVDWLACGTSQCWNARDVQVQITVLLFWTWCPFKLFCQVHNVSCKSAREISGIWETKHFWERLMILSVFRWNMHFYLERRTLQKSCNMQEYTVWSILYACDAIFQLFDIMRQKDMKINPGSVKMVTFTFHRYRDFAG